MTALEEYRELETEAQAKKAKVKELEILLVALDGELRKLEEELARQQQAIPRFEPIFVSPEVALPTEPLPIIEPEVEPRITFGEAIARPEWWWKKYLPWMGVGVTILGLIFILTRKKGEIK